MRIAAKSLLLLASLGAILANAQITSFQHVVVIVQENRTPDNLFQGLCKPPFGNANSCSATPTGSQYDIQTNNWLDKYSPGGTIQPTAVKLANKYDLLHQHKSFVSMCDLNQSGQCQMDGAGDVKCSGTCPPKPQFKFVANASGNLNPYLDLATQYGWANYMFQTNQGPSFPAHQFLFGGTSAPSADDDVAGIFAAENMGGTNGSGLAGCIARKGTFVRLITPQGENQQIYPCFEHQTLGDLLDTAGVSWKYYSPKAGSIWTAPNAIKHICQPSRPRGGTCEGPDWINDVVISQTQVLTDIGNCQLAGVTWVIPTAQNSDHAKSNTGGGPSWVASVVNAIGNSTACDGNTGYWRNTAIFITWDDWGGWYDHEPPTFLAAPEGDYQYGFRVPLLVVSAYTPAAYVNNEKHDFGSILRFVEQNFGIQEGALTFADKRATTDLTLFFNLGHAPRAFQNIMAPKNAEDFLNDKTPPGDPDDD